ncbi:MAG: GNAT family N-acetyltransferase [Arenimonas sp.]|jgi:ribosomal protein S18 acetylase RimI-like enzyme
MHPLDNPVWHSLRTRHASLARVCGGAARYPSDVAPFVAVASGGPETGENFAELVAKDESVLVVGPCPGLGSNWNVQTPVPIAQMVCNAPLESRLGPALTELSAPHLPDMLALTALVYPHYFRPRTPQMGRYLGIYDGDVLAAMAGERMGFDGHQEISAVCTHPRYLGRGYAQRLVVELSNASLASGRLPFLHVSHENLRAKSLYERLGYVDRADILLWSVQRLA